MYEPAHVEGAQWLGTSVCRVSGSERALVFFCFVASTQQPFSFLARWPCPHTPLCCESVCGWRGWDYVVMPAGLGATTNPPTHTHEALYEPPNGPRRRGCCIFCVCACPHAPTPPTAGTHPPHLPKRTRPLLPWKPTARRGGARQGRGARAKENPLASPPPHHTQTHQRRSPLSSPCVLCIFAPTHPPHAHTTGSTPFVARAAQQRGREAPPPRGKRDRQGTSWRSFFHPPTPTPQPHSSEA